jgi:hypothetical protein
VFDVRKQTVVAPVAAVAGEYERAKLQPMLDSVPPDCVLHGMYGCRTHICVPRGDSLGGSAPLAALLADAARQLLGDERPPLGAHLAHHLDDLPVLLRSTQDSIGVHLQPLMWRHGPGKLDTSMPAKDGHRTCGGHFAIHKAMIQATTRTALHVMTS